MRGRNSEENKNNGSAGRCNTQPDWARSACQAWSDTRCQPSAENKWNKAVVRNPPLPVVTTDRTEISPYLLSLGQRWWFRQLPVRPDGTGATSPNPRGSQVFRGRSPTFGIHHGQNELGAACIAEVMQWRWLYSVLRATLHKNNPKNKHGTKKYLVRIICSDYSKSPARLSETPPTATIEKKKKFSKFTDKGRPWSRGYWPPFLGKEFGVFLSSLAFLPNVCSHWTIQAKNRAFRIRLTIIYYPFVGRDQWKNSLKCFVQKHPIGSPAFRRGMRVVSEVGQPLNMGGEGPWRCVLHCTPNAGWFWWGGGIS